MPEAATKEPPAMTKESPDSLRARKRRESVQDQLEFVDDPQLRAELAPILEADFDYREVGP